MNLQGKDWVNHIIIGSGILVGIWIIIGFIFQVRYFLGNEEVYRQTIICENCITQADNNYQQTVASSTILILELPSEFYSEDNLVILQNPEDSFINMGAITPHNEGNWALQFEAVQEGYVDIEIKSNVEAVADYHTIIIIQ